ncbi:MAG TPA: tail fiber domain-containing protein [Bacteroidales bacterium]|nr:tail fiber domain-containing protein [Bacteroidales bacterium]HOK73857.1 tail fiber domain-containing protein [Bacteroidales bacterium]HPP91663.1 tail fiber domain-containing protein [Bacteroidales bacterium]
MKKNLLTFLFFAVSSFSFAQVPQGINYQAIARDNSGNPLQNTALQVKLAVKADSSWIGTVIWEEIHNPVTTNDFGLFTVVLGKGARQASSTVASFNLIDWNVTPKFLRTEIYYGGSWKQMGISRLQSVPYSMFSAKAESLTPGAKVVSTNDATSDALFEVKRKDGQTVFAVYPDAVNIYVPSGSKGTKGGFAIGGFGDKAPSQDYFRVTPDSVRIYIDNSPSTKGTKGGFAIGGFDGTKGLLKNYYMNVSGTSTLDTVKGSPQVLWFPNRNAFLAGNVWIGSPDSVGLYSTALGYRSVAMGDYSQAFGYRAKALGNYSTSIGKNSIAGAGKTTAMNAFAFGNGAKATGPDSYALGSGATATGERAFAFGSVGLNDSGDPTSTPTTASASYTVAIGMGAQATNKGAMALGIGSTASGSSSSTFGYYSTASSSYAMALGYKSQATQSYTTAVGAYASATSSYSSAFGRSATAQGNSSVAVGYAATTGALATNASAFGRGANATGPSAMALGVSATASGDTSVAIGYLANASNKYAVAIGYASKASAKNSFSFGYNSEAAADNSFAIGTYGLNADGSVNTSRPTKTSDTYSVAIGMGAQTSLKGDMAMGVNATASGGYSTAIGYQPQSLGTYATALGYMVQANGPKSISIGAYYNYTGFRLIYDPITRRFRLIPYNVTKFNIANDEFSIAIGNGNTASKGGMAFGTNNSSLAFGSTTLGINNRADSAYSVAIGSNAQAVGINAIALGESVTAEASNSIVVGYNNITNSAYKRDEWEPTDPLFVVGNGGTGTPSNAMVVQKNGNTTIYGNLTVTGSISSWVGTGDNLGNHTASQNIKLNNYWLSNDGGSEGVWVSTTGLVGINRNNPAYNLDVNGNFRATSHMYGNGNLYMTGSIYGSTINPDGDANLTVDAGTLHVDGTNNRVGVNNTAPAYTLDISGSLNATSSGRFGGDVTISNTSPALNLTDSDLNADDFKIEVNNDLLQFSSLGKTPVVALAINATGKVGMPSLSSGSGTTLVISAVTGEILKQSSSARYKMNISLLNDISWLYKLNPVTFLYKEDKSKTLQYGLIAEEVENINPSLVVYDAEGKPDAVIYNNLISVLIKAAQEQKEEIEILKSENQTLKERLERLENIVLTLKAVQK